MMRKKEVRFGSFDRLRATPVHSRDWWFCRAEGVKLDGAEPSWYDLNSCRVLVEAHVEKPAPDRIDADWVRENLPIALGLNPSFDKSLTPIDLDVVALGFDRDVDVAYPFLLRERERLIFCGFSPDGPPAKIRDNIIVELGARLLWAAEGGFL
jgi:hypothetical protein